MSDRKRKKSQPELVAGLLDGIFTHKPLAKRLCEGKIWLVWNAVVGKQIAVKAQPVNFRDGVLTVLVTNAPWMQQLNFLKQGIIEKLNVALAEEVVKEIVLKAGRPQHAATVPITVKKPGRALSSAEKKRVAEETLSIEDRELREALAALFAEYLSKKPQHN